MTVQPDELAFYHPHEEGERPRTLVSLFTEDTVPNVPVTIVDEAMHVVLKHVVEFVEADTEDPFVRYCCLVADLGYKVPEEGFWGLVDAYDDPMTPAYAEHWNGLLRDYLEPYTEAVTPRVLQYGDPEPDPDTKWQSKGGTIWHHDGTGWCTDNLLPDGIPWRGTGEWEAFSTFAFPMTEERP